MAYRSCFKHLGSIDRRRIPPTSANHLRLHRLERLEPWADDLLQAIWAAQHPINQYPDYAEFHERLAAFVGMPCEQIVLGAGIEDFIRSLFILSCDPGDAVAFTWPTCAMFDIYAEVFGARVAHIIAEPGKPFGVQQLLAQLPDDAKLLILPNPGQPVETCFSPAEMRLIATHCQKIDCVLAIDEAYHGFGAPSCMELVDEFDNVLVLRTFSKAFGAAGIRVGYAVGQASVLKPLDAIRESGEVAGPSLTAATVLMDHWESHVRHGIVAVCEGRDWLRVTLGERATGSVANHVLIDMGSEARAALVATRLKSAGVHVKAFYPPPLERHLLVTCGSVPIMEKFWQAFQAAL